jgi:hypothetical protein
VKILPRLRQRRAQIFPAAKQQVIKPFQFQPLFRRESGATQADDVQPADFVHAQRHGERRQILADGRAALHQRQRADAAELMHKSCRK